MLNRTKLLRMRRKKPRHTRTPPGAPPGTLTPDPQALPPVIRILAFGEDRFVEAEIDDPDELRAYLREWPTTWVNVDGLGDVEKLQKIGTVFGLHRLALEDVVNVHQRPKLEEYEDQIYLVARMPRVNAEPVRELDLEQLSLFLGSNYVLTFQEHPGDCLEPVRARLREARGQIRNLGADYLAYAVVDAVVDSYFPVLEDYGEHLDLLEDAIAAHPTVDTLNGIHRIKRDLLSLRRAVWPMRDALNALIRDPGSLVGDRTRLYLRDCYDHALRLLDVVETYRELGTGLTEFQMSSIGNRMNEVMKVLTVIATIFIPLTFIAGVYGMNFDPQASPLNMPELEWYWGYPFALSLMALLSAALLIYFRRKGWIGPAGLPGVDADGTGHSEPG